MPSPFNPLVLIPAYNPGARLPGTVTAALQHCRPVLLVVDGSTDGSHRPVLEQARDEADVLVLELPRNRGKGAAVLAGMRRAAAGGFTHALVMDADGQHPAASIPEFLAASLRRPEAMILGRPVFGADVPGERRHGRKLSIALVHFETLGRTIADPLFGFRVYPIGAVLTALERRRGGRRYDFDTEAAVRLAWAGVPAVNLAAPVRYFSRAEAGVSHFHYGRDNLRLVWLHTRLITELLARRLPSRLWPRHPRAGTKAATVAAILLAALPAARPARAAESAIVRPDLKLNADRLDAGWRSLFAALRHRTTVEAPFEEQRWFPFRRKPVVLSGVVRIDAVRGLSLHYEKPQTQTVIIDDHGMVIRENGRDTVPPPDRRARLADAALLHVLRFNLAALAGDFELYGRLAAGAWTLELVPRDREIRRTLGTITVQGVADRVRRIHLRRSATERVDILVGAPRPEAPFSADELHRYFR